MALTRKLLESMGLEKEKIDSIIEAHSETVDALKSQRDEFKADSEKLSDVQKKLDKSEKELNELKESGGDWEKKYSSLSKEYEDYKQEQDAKAEKRAKEKAYKKLLEDAGVSGKRIDSVLRVSDISGLEYKDGEFADKDNIVKSIKEEWSDFITTTSTQGATTTTPVKNDGGKLEMKDIYKKENGRYVMSASERQQALIEASTQD